LHGAAAYPQGQSAGAATASSALATFAVAKTKSKVQTAHKQNSFWVISILLKNRVIF
jgi:hypothetical protein